MWKKTEINVGRVKAGEIVEAVFEYEGDIEVLKQNGEWKIVPGCGCTVPSWNPTTKKLHATYKGKKIPKHLAHKNSFITSVLITVYTTGNSYVLKIKSENYE